MLQLTNIHKTFNQGTINEKKALDGVNLDLKDGDFATIVGSNGAGKSTLFNAIAGGFYVEKGSILLDGEDITYRQCFGIECPDIAEELYWSLAIFGLAFFVFGLSL